MNYQLWSWVLGILGLLGFYLAGKKVWWCWYINIFNQILWLAYSLVSHQYGFLVATAGYTIVFVKNAYSWTREHRENWDLKHGEPIGRVTDIREDAHGISVDFQFDSEQFVRGVGETQRNLPKIMKWEAARFEMPLPRMCAETTEHDGIIHPCQLQRHDEVVQHFAQTTMYHLLQGTKHITLRWDADGVEIIEEVR